MNESEVLQAFHDTRALLRGHFELRSGLHSERYFQCARLLQHPRVTARLCEALVAGLDGGLRRGDGAVQTVIAPAMGGIVIGHEVARHLDVRSIFAEKEDGRLVLRRGFTVGEGERFLVAEDVVTRGGRVQETIDIVRAAGGVVAAVAVLVDRSGGTAAFGVPLHSLLRITPVTWASAECPLCARGEPLAHPGSR